jgi:hypothetical protein
MMPHHRTNPISKPFEIRDITNAPIILANIYYLT